MTIYISHDNCYTFKRFFKVWEPAQRGKIRFIYYADLAHRRTLPHELSLFTDLERLSPEYLAVAREAARQLKSAGAPVVNDPSRVLRRYDLLRALHADGTNNFQCFRLDDDRAALRFPVFLRLEREHQGNLTPLLNTEAELERAIAQAVGAGVAGDDLLIVEYCDVRSADGWYRKYAFFVAADCFIPRHLLFNRHWMSKNPESSTAALANEEMKFLMHHPHPHEPFMRALFQRAGIEYGRVDYSLQGDKIRVWEINTNPNLIPEKLVQPERQSGWDSVRRAIGASLQKLLDDEATLQNGSTLGGSTPDTKVARIPFVVPRLHRKALDIRSSDRWRHPLQRAVRPLTSQRGRRILRQWRLAK